ncbi:MAG: MATE family efflux transporter [Gammaproteobacteria bacterium]|nr:MATE family efflux transporter [Gammaproteobacteria bacterium]NIR83447.1 MATE family efflux transporter [Gammaproteobacteria bacterium]NIR91369.1 MATE family efflux transporter [Gammaproteobacteria bacterium]NIU04609.1 MATE family efflux transporter [Gammaproteobacteria bacterium]NIV51651.1 MATE family efflux transporter [Gammaproteobacteria bacterium]
MSVPLVGSVDTAVMGHLPDPAYIGAVALGAVVFSFLYWGFGFLRMGTTGFAAQAYGAGDALEVRSSLGRGLLLAGCLGSAVVALHVPIGALAWRLFGATEQVETLAAAYYAIRVWSAPAALANYALLGFFIGIQNTRVALALQLALNGVNVALDLLFVVGFGWGVRGVALASLVSEYAAVAMGLAAAGIQLRRIGGEWQWIRLLESDRLRALLHVNFNILVRTLCLIFAFAWFTNTGARLGEVVLAANAVLMQLQMFLSYGLDGFAHAAEALAGGAYGARNRDAFRSAVRASTLWAFAVAAIYALVYAAAGPFIIDVMTSLEAVRTEARAYLPWLVVSPLLCVWSFQLDGVFIGATRPVEMRNGMILSLAAYLAATYLLVPPWGNHGLWLSLMVFMVARAVTLGLWFPRIERGIA